MKTLKLGKRLKSKYQYTKRRRYRRKSGITMLNKQFNHTAVPARYFTKLTIGACGYMPSTAGKNFGYFSVFAGQLYAPFNSDYPINAQNGNFTLTSGSSAGAQYPGYSALAALYQGYKVHGVKTKVTLMNSNTTDTLNIVCAYLPTVDIASLPILNYEDLMAQPGAKTRVIQPTTSGKDNTIVISTKMRNLCGFTKQQYMAQPPTKFTATPPQLYNGSYIFYWDTINGSNTSSQIFISITQTVYVELNNPYVLT